MVMLMNYDASPAGNGEADHDNKDADYDNSHANYDISFGPMRLKSTSLLPSRRERCAR